MISWLYQFTIGSVDYFHTNAKTDVIWNGQTWLSCAINSESPTADASDALRSTFNLQIRETQNLSQAQQAGVLALIGASLTTKVALSVIKLINSVGLTVWRGGLVSIERARDGLYQAQFASVGQRLHQINSNVVLKTCRHAFGDDYCQAPVPTVSNTILSVNQPKITLSQALPDNYVGGYLVQGAVSAAIIAKASANEWILSNDGITTGIAIFYAGCEKTLDACTFYNNLNNFGGFPLLLNDDPNNSAVY